MSEWLRRQTWNLLGYARAGSNPAVDEMFCSFVIYLFVERWVELFLSFCSFLINYLFTIIILYTIVERWAGPDLSNYSSVLHSAWDEVQDRLNSAVAGVLRGHSRTTKRIGSCRAAAVGDRQQVRLALGSRPPSPSGQVRSPAACVISGFWCRHELRFQVWSRPPISFHFPVSIHHTVPRNSVEGSRVVVVAGRAPLNSAAPLNSLMVCGTTYDDAGETSGAARGRDADSQSAGRMEHRFGLPFPYWCSRRVAPPKSSRWLHSLDSNLDDHIHINRNLIGKQITGFTGFRASPRARSENKS
jgi:hypothetical protein